MQIINYNQLDAVMQGVLSQNPCNYIDFYGRNKDFLTLSAPESMLSGPAETGKTFTALYKFHSLIKQTPNAQAVMVRKTRKSMTNTVLVTFEKKILHPNDNVVTYGGSNVQWYDYPNGARVYVVGIDNPDRILSGEFDYVYVNQAEELDLEDWELVTTRTTGRAGNAQKVGLLPQQFGDCNPGPAKHWILERAKANSLIKIDSKHEDNPILFNQDTKEITEQGVRSLAQLDKLTGSRHKRLRLGLWVSAEGAVYEDDFEFGIHVIQRSELPTMQRHFRVIDFGFTNPFVCLWAGTDYDGRLYVYREHYKTKTLVEDHARVINNFTQAYEFTLTDHDAEDRATLERHLTPRMLTKAAKKDVTAGIDAVRARLKVQDDGKPRLFFVNDLLLEKDRELEEKSKPTSILDEFGMYVYPKDVSGKPVKEQPVKDHDHALDALRYLCMELEKPSTTVRFRSLS